MVLAVKLKVCPAHIGPLLPAVGAAGGGLTVTLVIPGRLEQPLTVTTNVYAPVAVVCALVMDAFCVPAAKLFGPLQLYVAPVTAPVVRFNV